jgi:hypothetical protein
MNSAIEFWQHVENAFWWWWAPIVAMSVASIYYMAQLSAPYTVSGTLSRIYFLFGYACMLGGFCFEFFAWGHTGLVRIGMLAIVAGATLLIRQYALACKVERRQAASDPRFGKRVLAALVEDR